MSNDDEYFTSFSLAYEFLVSDLTPVTTWTLCSYVCNVQGGAKTGPAYLIANIMKIPWPNCVEIGELLQCEYAEHSH